MGCLVEMMAHEFTGLVLHGKEWVFHELPRPGALKGALKPLDLIVFHRLRRFKRRKARLKTPRHCGRNGWRT